MSRRKRNEAMQALCRKYLTKIRYMARKHGLLAFVDETISLNRQNKCEATKKEVDMLARLCDDERLHRSEVPEVLGKSYRQCAEDGDFDNIEKLPHAGIYSKTSTMLYKSRIKNGK